MSSSNPKNMLQITKQPKLKKYYWRHRGQILGDGTADFPKLRLAIPKATYMAKTEYYILCSLHSYAADDTVDRQAATNDKMLPLSKHFIANDEDEDYDEFRHTGHKNIFEAMKLQKSLNNEYYIYTYELVDHRVVLVDLADNGGDQEPNDGVWERSWNERKSQLHQMNLELLDENGASQKSDKTVVKVCFGFTAFEKLPDNENFTRITPTVYSNSVSLNANLEVRQLVPPYVDVYGGDSVVLFLNTLKRYNSAMVKVYACEFLPGQRIELIDSIDIGPKNEQGLRNCFWDKNTIVFRAPKLPTHLPHTAVVEVYIPSTGETSNSVNFNYQISDPIAADNSTSTSERKCNTDTLSNVIKISDPTEQSIKVTIRPRAPVWIVIHDSISKDFLQHFDAFKDCLYVVTQFPMCSPSFRVSVDNGFKMNIPTNVILLSEAVASSFKKANLLVKKPFTLLTARRRRCKQLNANDYNMITLDALEYAMDFFEAYNELMITEENTKHLYPGPAQKTNFNDYFFLSDKRDFRPMINAKCSLVEVDTCSNTPLHAAIELKHMESIEQFKNIFANYSKYSKGFQKDLKEVFSVRNDNGHTVMHAAIWSNMEDLVEAMLAFCKKNSIKLKDCKESILQLAINNKLPNIVDKILHYFPDAKEREASSQ